MQEVIIHIRQPYDYLQLVLTISTVAIALISVLFTAKSYSMLKKHHKRMVLPIVHILADIEAQHMILTLKNSGVGPAVIKQITWMKNEKPFKSFFELMKQTLSSDEQRAFYVVNCNEAFSISPSDSICLVSMKETAGQVFVRKKEEIVKSVNLTLSNVKLLIEYTDVYDQQFSMTYEFIQREGI